ncbi:MAG: histidine--tRNA ligase [Candidatus Diapherotrites archaeon]|nr:histidine--tRNA ligase [Candidatus Diapherotrites archaeon]
MEKTAQRLSFQAVRGMRDLLPEQASKKQAMLDRVRKEFEAYGFEPLETPVVESFEILAIKESAGEAIKDEIYYFKDKSDRELGLRFDLTVPLARVIAGNPQLSKPFKRFEIGKVYRYDRPGAKRYREFTQADADIIGSNSIMADFEIIALAYKIMKDLSFTFTIKVSNKQLLEEIALACGVKKEQLKDCMRSLDKLDKIGIDGVKKELDGKEISTKILNAIKENSIERIEKIIKEKTGLNDLKELLEYCEKAGLGEFVKFDASLARGLEYYTGNVFEISVEGAPSVGGGGRYDKLIETYGGSPTPAVGISFGIDRLLDLREKEVRVQKTQIMVVPIGFEAGKKSLEIARDLRNLGLNVENDLMQRSLTKNMEFASKKKIPYVLIVGENELKSGELTLKNLETGKQEKVKIKELAKLKSLI